MSLHSPLAPSSAAQWRWCSGSVMLSAGIEDEETEAQREGTAGHWVCEQILFSYINPGASILTAQDFVDKLAPNGVLVTEEMFDAAVTYTSEILYTCNEHGLLQQLHIEQPVTMPEIHAQCWGTPDCWAFDQAGRTLYLWDFKYGHSPVHAFENWQMICYVLGILKLVTNNQPLQDFGITVVVRVIQPRCYDGHGPLREWIFNAVDLRGHINILSQAAHAALGEHVECNTGPHCKHCKGAVHCPALRNAVACVIDHSHDAIPEPMNDVQLAFELEKLTKAEALLKSRRDALEADAEHRLRSGGAVPGWMLQQGYGRDKWNDEAGMIAMGPMLGAELKAPDKAITPNQAKDQLKKKGIDPIILEGMYHKPPAGMKLKFDDGLKARKIFSNGELK